MTFGIFNEDCLEGMKRIPAGAIDFILTDLPYGITDCDFDVRIPFEPMWEQFKRVTKRNAAIALFASGKFLIKLAASNLRDYRYKWVWHKNLGTGFLNAKKMPLRCHEDILIFYQALPTYNPQFVQGKPWARKGLAGSKNYQAFKDEFAYRNASSDGKRYPRDVQSFNVPFTLPKDERPKHNTAKPVPLLEYLIKTYSNEGETVLDATMGSGSTGVACMNTRRNFIGFETEEKFFDIAANRINDAQNRKLQELF